MTKFMDNFCNILFLLQNRTFLFNKYGMLQLRFPHQNINNIYRSTDIFNNMSLRLTVTLIILLLMQSDNALC